MFDTEYSFEIELTIGNGEYATFTGTALLEGETGPHDYGFSCTGIKLDGNRAGGAFSDKRTVQINAKSDDPSTCCFSKSWRLRLKRIAVLPNITMTNCGRRRDG